MLSFSTSNASHPSRCKPPKSLQLVARLDGDRRYTKHAHPDKTLLDAKAGDVVVNQRKQYGVTAIKPYRTSLCRDESQYPFVTSGREFLESTK